jgi:tRNA-specific 2-thiouridylase
MELIGADTLATGHYARIERQPDGSPALLRAVDRSKDQSYALALVPFAALARASFPLGGMTKDEVRGHGERFGLRVWDKPESQDLCFVPDGDYAGFMERSLGETRGTVPGEFVTADGRRLGTHRGIIHYTVGQRRGLGLPGSERLYVLEIDPAENAVVVGPRAALDVEGLETERVNWLLPAPPPGEIHAQVKIRYHHAPVPARVRPLAGGAVEVRFETPQPAVTPGQLAVLYHGEQVLGGGTIARALPIRPASRRPPASAAGAHANA